MKTNKHRFVVTVETTYGHSSARYALLSIFASRKPDGVKLAVTALRKNYSQRKS